MAGMNGKIVLACLGVSLGLIFFGVSVSLTQFNRLVDPRHPLQLLEWRVEEDQLGIRVLGENLVLKLDRELPGKWEQKISENIAPVMHEMHGWSAGVLQGLSESRWLEKAEITVQKAVQKAGHFITATMEKLKEVSEL